MVRRFDQILHIRACDHETRADLYQFGHLLDVAADSPDAENFAVRFAGFRRRFIGRTQIRIFQLSRNAHGRAEVILPDQQHFYPGQRSNGIGICNAFRRLQHGNEHGRGISLFVDLAKRRLTIALQWAGAADPTFA